MKRSSIYWPLWAGMLAGGIYLAWTGYALFAASPVGLAIWRIFDSFAIGFVGVMYIIFLIRTAKRRRQAEEALERAETARLEYQDRIVEAERARRYYIEALDRHARRLLRRTTADIINESQQMAGQTFDELPAAWVPIEPVHPQIGWGAEWDSRIAPGNAVPQ